MKRGILHLGFWAGAAAFSIGLEALRSAPQGSFMSTVAVAMVLIGLLAIVDCRIALHSKER